MSSVVLQSSKVDLPILFQAASRSVQEIGTSNLVGQIFAIASNWRRLKGDRRASKGVGKSVVMMSSRTKATQ
jgi:hypothetical protein